jgi:MoaA/NifB/PqqE/SkfB family radical SAM enzyme
LEAIYNQLADGIVPSGKRDLSLRYWMRREKRMEEKLADFPKVVSFTVTNRCNLHCRMCAQWSEEGYMLKGKAGDSYSGNVVRYEDLLKVVDEVQAYGVPLIIRGGEPLLYPHIVDLLTYIKAKGVSLSLETNAVLLKKYAELLVKLRIDNMIISIDGPEEIHDHVRGVKGTFARVREGLQELEKHAKNYGYKIPIGITCTLSADNYQALGGMPDVIRSLGLGVICIVPYYYFPEEQGLAYEKLMREEFNCEAYSWRGFHHEGSGVDVELFLAQLEEFKSKLGELQSYPYMAFTDDEYREWYSSSDTTIHQARCNNIWGLLDVQPDGNVNFCVDFPDYAIGNVAESTLHQLWHSDMARKFRELRTKMEMPVCTRCGAKYMG